MAITGRRERVVLAVLSAWAGEAVSTNRLIDAVWSERPPRSCEKALQNAVMQLRKVLSSEVIETCPGGYALRIGPDALDLWRFERLVGDGRARARRGEQAAAESRFSDALALWRGTPLVELGDWGPAVSERSRLEELHRTVVEESMEAALKCGRHHELIADLERLVTDEPLRERRWRLLMLGLYRCGRQADGLRAFQTARSALGELGLEPGVELRSLERAITVQDPTLSRADDGGLAEAWLPRTYLLTDVVNSVALWEADIDAMARAIARHDALVAQEITAAGGMVVRAKGEGDSTFSVFARPLDAVGAAAALQRAVADEPWPLTAPFQVRLGIHTGEAEARDGDWYGPAVNRAARLRGLGGGGQTLVSGVTAGLVADKLPTDLRLIYRGRRTLRGIERPEEVWELGEADDPRFTTEVMRPTGTTALPAPLSRFVGRRLDLARLGELLGECRLVTLTGPGGTGKTRLAVELAHRLAGLGVTTWYAELAPLRDAGPLVDVIAEAIGVEPGPDRLTTLQSQAEQLDGVLVLDNCEHLLEACTTLVRRLLRAGHQLRVLTTSREPLGLTGERVWPVDPLGVPTDGVRDRRQLAATQASELESVELLLDRARALRPDLELTDEAVPAVVRICRALDGIPLALELAAARLHALNFQALAERLDDQPTLLARPRSAADDDERHRSLRLAIGWSYDMLTPPQQGLAQGLSVFAGGFRLDAVGELLGGYGDLLDGIDELVAKSLVTFDPSSARYQFLEPIRQYLAEQLSVSGEGDDVRRAHAEWVADLCAQLGRRLVEDQRASSSRLGEERSNIEVALGWAYEHDIALATRVVGSLGPYWFSHDQASGRRWCEPVLAAAAALPDRARARARLAAGIVAQNDHDWDRSIRHLNAALVVYRAHDVPAGQAVSLMFLGRALLSQVPLNNAEPADPDLCIAEALDLFTRLGNVIGANTARGMLSSSAFLAGDLHRSEALADQVVQDCLATGVRQPMGQALCNLAYIARRRGDDNGALALLRDAEAVFRDLGDAWDLAMTLAELAGQQARMGLDGALRDLAESAQLDEQIGSLPRSAFTLALAATVHLSTGHPALAAKALGAYDASGHTLTDWRPGEGVMSHHVGWLTQMLQETRAALDPAAVADAAAAARGQPLEAAIDELIIAPAAGM